MNKDDTTIYDLLSNVDFLGAVVGGILGAIFATLITILLSIQIKDKDNIDDLSLKHENNELRIINKNSFVIRNLVLFYYIYPNKRIKYRIPIINSNDSYDVFLASEVDQNKTKIRKTRVPLLLRFKKVFKIIDKKRNVFFGKYLLKIKIIFIMRDIFFILKNNNKNMLKLYFIDQNINNEYIFKINITKNENIVYEKKIIKNSYSFNTFSIKTTDYYSSISFLIKRMILLFERTPVKIIYNNTDNIFSSNVKEYRETLSVKIIKTNLKIKFNSILKLLFLKKFKDSKIDFFKIEYYKEFLKRKYEIEKIEINRLSNVNEERPIEKEGKVVKLNILDDYNTKILTKIELKRKFKKFIFQIDNNKFMYYGDSEILKRFSLMNNIYSIDKENLKPLPNFLKVEKDFFILNLNNGYFLKSHVLKKKGEYCFIEGILEPKEVEFILKSINKKSRGCFEYN